MNSPYHFAYNYSVDPNWPQANGIKPEQIPKPFIDKMTDVTATLQEQYKDGPPATVVSVARVVSEKHGIPLPTTMKFLQIVHKAAEGLMKNSPFPFIFSFT